MHWLIIHPIYMYNVRTAVLCWFLNVLIVKRQKENLFIRFFVHLRAFSESLQWVRLGFKRA